MKHETVLTEIEKLEIVRPYFGVDLELVALTAAAKIEQAILTKLADATQPVAWRVQHISGDWTVRETPTYPSTGHYKAGSLQPIYTHPPIPSALLEAAENACDFLRLVADCEGDLCKAEEVADKLQFAIKAHKKCQS